MESKQKEFLKLLSDYQNIIHKVNQIYFKSKDDKEDNFQEVVYHLWRSFPALQNKEKPASWIQMRKYTTDKPIKEWMEYGIEEIEKSIKFNTKYNWVLYGCSFFSAIGFYAAYQIVTNTRLSILTTIVVPLGIIIYLLIVRRSLNRNYQKALDELKDLYKEFEK